MLQLILIQPTTGAAGAWSQAQTTLTNVIGEANYDIGHLFGATGGGGNAGCIGCVCVSPTINIPLGKGSALLRLQMGFHKAIL
jgi:hypothetical protein